MKILIVFYSMYGHIYKLAEAVAEGAREIKGADVSLRRVPETLGDDILGKMGALESQKEFSGVPVCTVDELAEADAIIFGTPTRFGIMCGQMKQFLDATGKHWMSGALVGKVGSVFTSTATQHGGQESTILSFHIPLMAHGMILVGLPYTFKGLMGHNEVSGGTPFGASTIAGGDGSRQPNGNELDGARFQGRHVAGITAKLTA